MRHARVIEIGRLIDEGPFSRYQLLVALLCGAIVFMDGFDAQSMGFVAPALAADLGIARTAMGPLLSSGLAGMMFGALGLGLLADRWGRKPVLIVATLVFGVGSLVCATAESYEALLVYRFVTGLGLGRRDAEHDSAHRGVHAEAVSRDRGDADVLRRVARRRRRRLRCGRAHRGVRLAFDLRGRRRAADLCRRARGRAAARIDPVSRAQGRARARRRAATSRSSSRGSRRRCRSRTPRSTWPRSRPRDRRCASCSRSGASA